MTLLFLVSSAFAVLPKENPLPVRSAKPVTFFEVERGHHSPERIRFERKKVDGHEVDVLSYLVKGRQRAQLILTESARTKFFADFEKALPVAKRSRLAMAGACGQVFVVRTRLKGSFFEKIETVCLDQLPGFQTAAIGKWWKEHRVLVGL